MALTEGQLARREDGLGSSDIATVCGLNPFRTPFDVWLSKRTPSRGPVESARFMGNARTRMGDRLEPVILGYYAEEHLQGRRVTVPGYTIEGPEAWMLATPDLLVAAEGAGAIDMTNPAAWSDRLAEAKAVGTRMRRDWRVDEEDEDPYGKPTINVPLYVQCQVQWQMGVARVPWCDVVAYFGGTDEPLVEPVAFEPDTFGELVELCARFWRDYVQGDTPPPPLDTETLLERSRKLFPTVREPDILVLADDSHLVSAVEAYFDAKGSLKLFEKRADDALGRLLAEIGDREGILGDRIGKLTWPVRKGNPSYKAIAEKLYRDWVEDAPMPEEFINEFRGAPTRVVNARGLKDPRTEGGKA